MKTTLDLPDDLMRTVKVKAAREDSKLKDTLADLLRRGLERSPAPAGEVRKRVKLPLVSCAHAARAGEEMTPDRVAEALTVEEGEAVSDAQSVR